MKREPMFCYSFYDGSNVSFGYSLSQRQVSIKAHNMVLRRYLSEYNNDIEYRTPYKGNRYFGLQVSRKIGFKLFNYNYDLWSAAGYKRIKSNYQKVTEQFFLGPRLDRNRMFNITAAYARQQTQLSDGGNQTSNGIMLALYKDFRDLPIMINTSCTYWFSHMQYTLRTRYIKGIVFVGVGWEKANKWWEVDAEVGVRI